jgi:hypothetical protein
MLDTVVDKLEQELRRYRNKPFLEERFEGVRTYEKDLLELLKSREIVTEEEILTRLGVTPVESDAINISPGVVLIPKIINRLIHRWSQDAHIEVSPEEIFQKPAE